MEPLYPQNIVERTFPFYREQREKAEKELIVRSTHEDASADPSGEDSEEDEMLYFEIPYEGGPAGRHLNTLA